jgi:antitoxin (DNA-binding transcriptional repressor) of toxin-antitoxin stability system
VATITVTLDEIQRDLIGYLRRVKAGETLVILEANEPVAEIKPVASDEAHLRPYAPMRWRVSSP